MLRENEDRIFPYQPLPWVFMEESQGHIECRPSPALETISVLVRNIRVWCDLGQVDGANTGRQKRLLGVSPCRVRDENARVLSNASSEALGTFG